MELAVVRTEVGGDAAGTVLLEGREGVESMDEVKRTYRDVETDLKKTARDVDGTDPTDRVGNAGDEARKDLGNMGDDVRKAGREPEGPRGDPATTPEPTM
jgi:hypothetical protein